MSPSTVLDVLQMDIGTVVPSMTGTLTKLFKREQKIGSRGAYSYQRGEISDGENTVSIIFWNRPDISRLRMKEVLLESVDKGKGLSGVEFGEDNKQQPQIAVQDKANVREAGAQRQDPNDNDPEMQNADLDEAQPPAQKQAPAAAKPRTSTVAADALERPTRKDLDVETRKHAVRLVNLRLIAAHASDMFIQKYTETGGRRKYTETDVKEIETGFYITLERAGHDSAMPSKLVCGEEPPAPPPETKPETPPAI